MSDEQETPTAATFEHISDYEFGANKNAPDNKNIPLIKLNNAVPKTSEKKDVPNKKK